MRGTCRKCRAEDVAMYQERAASHSKKMLQRIRNIWQVTVRRGDNVSGRSCNLLTSRKMLQRIRNVLQATWRRCCKIPGTSFKGLEEDVRTSCMEHVGSVAQKMSQCIRNVLQVIWRRCYNVSGTSGKLLYKTRWHMYQEGRAIYLQVGRCCNVSGMYCKLLDDTWRRCCNIARTSFKGLEEDVTTSCMEHVGRAAQKMSQCSRNVLQVTRRRCYNVSGTSGKLL